MKKDIINRKICICKNNLKQKINFGNLPLINNYKTKKNLVKYPTIITDGSSVTALTWGSTERFVGSNVKSDSEQH